MKLCKKESVAGVEQIQEDLKEESSQRVEMGRDRTRWQDKVDG